MVNYPLPPIDLYNTLPTYGSSSSYGLTNPQTGWNNPMRQSLLGGTPINSSSSSGWLGDIGDLFGENGSIGKLLGPLGTLTNVFGDLSSLFGWGGKGKVLDAYTKQMEQQNKLAMDQFNQALRMTNEDRAARDLARQSYFT